jgi:hypothetical protein
MSKNRNFQESRAFKFISDVAFFHLHAPWYLVKRAGELAIDSSVPHLNQPSALSISRHEPIKLIKISACRLVTEPQYAG